MKINYNVSAVVANAALTVNEKKFNVSTERLSTGYKVNHAKENPSGIAIAKRMNAQLKGLSQSKDNASTAVSVVSTAEGALTEIQSMIQRMNELSVQAATGTKTDSDRESIQEEIKELKEEIERMKAEAEANAEADKKEKERIDKLNQADSLIFSTENQLKDLGDKIPADKKAPIEAALQKLKDAHKAQDLAGIDAASAELQSAFQAASAEMYAQTGAQAGPNAGQANTQNGGKNDNVQDADFEEVK